MANFVYPEDFHCAIGKLLFIAAPVGAAFAIILLRTSRAAQIARASAMTRDVRNTFTHLAPTNAASAIPVEDVLRTKSALPTCDGELSQKLTLRFRRSLCMVRRRLLAVCHVTATASQQGRFHPEEARPDLGNILLFQDIFRGERGYSIPSNSVRS